MRVRALLAVLLLVAGGLVLWSSRSGRVAEAPAERVSAPASAPTKPVGPPYGGEDLREPAAHAERSLSTPDEPVAAGAASSPALDAPAPTDGGGLSLSGLLRHSGDGRPAAGQELAFHFGDRHALVVTDSTGRFETEPVVLAGAVRAWHMGANLPIEPETFLAEPGPGGELQEIELVLVDPPGWVEIETVSVGGAPAVAELNWAFDSGGSSGVRRRRAGNSTTDVHGRARFPFTSTDELASFRILARGSVELVSEVATVWWPAPEEPVRLVLAPGGRLRARVRTEAGQPVAEERLTLRSSEAELELESGVTDASGEALFSRLPPGRHTVHAWAGLSIRASAQAVVKRGLTSDVELVVPPLSLAVAGHVLDEHGQALQGVPVVASFDDHRVTALTDEDGAFTVARSGSGSIRVAVQLALDGDRFDPPEARVAFGTTGLAFRRRAPLSVTQLTLQIIDAATQEPLPDAMVLAFVVDDDWYFFPGSSAGLVTLEVKLHEDVRLTAEAVGYRRRELRAVDLGPEAAAGAPFRIALERGLARTLLVLDDPDEEPVVGARVFHGELQVGMTDGEGRAHLDLAEWPVELRVEAPGHEPDTFECAEWLSELGDGLVYLARLPSEDAGRGR